MRLSANQCKRTLWEDNIGTHISIKLCQMIKGVTMEINSPIGQEIHWIREMMRQGTVVGRHATAVVVQLRHIFFIRYGTRTGFSLVKKRNRKPIPYTGARG